MSDYALKLRIAKLQKKANQRSPLYFHIPESNPYAHLTDVEVSNLYRQALLKPLTPSQLALQNQLDQMTDTQIISAYFLAVGSKN